MKNFFVLTDAVNYIEEHLCQEFTPLMVAEHCHVSLSSLQKLFRYAMHKSLKEYIIKRRICCAARDILDTKLTITEVAYRYQFGSPEVFTRAFRKVWNETPSSFQKHWRFSGIFPKIDYHYNKGEDFDMARKKVDLSEAYELFRKLSGSYVLCFDVSRMADINKIDRDAGDMAIVEAARRIDEARDDEMPMFRIGGDEFALITGLYDLDAVHALSQRITGQNGTAFSYKGAQIPLSLHVAMTTVPVGTFSCSDFFTTMKQSIMQSVEQERAEH